MSEFEARLIGRPLPGITLYEGDGREVPGSGLTAGSRAAVLYFMRAYDCGRCQGHARQLSADAPALDERGISVYVIGPGDPRGAAELAGGLDLAVPILSDPDAAAHEAIGFHRRLMMIQQSGVLLLDADGVVRYARRATDPAKSYDPAALWAAVDALAASGDAVDSPATAA